MTEDSSLKKWEDMFDIGPSSKSDDDSQAEEYARSSDSEEPFDKLTEDVSAEVGSVSDKGKALDYKKPTETPHDIIMDITSREEPEQVEEKVEEVKESKAEATVDMFEDYDSIPETEIIKKEEAVKEIKEVHEKMEEKEYPEEIKKEHKLMQEESHNTINIESVSDIIEATEKSEESSLDSVGDDNFSLIDGDNVKWSLKSPSVMYDSFYRQKKIVLDSCLIGGQVQFSLWKKELEEASVDVVSEVFDQQVIIKQMEEVQQFRNRVKYIGVRVNNQYFLFDRFTPLLRGYLARIQYLKPVLKQDGLILEHMGDVEMYFERLRGLHKSVADTEKNLAAAYEMLSRKVTICMELPPAERYSKPEEKTYKFQSQLQRVEEEVPEEMEEFDELPTGAKAGPKENVSGPTGWDKL